MNRIQAFWDEIADIFWTYKVIIARKHNYHFFLSKCKASLLSTVNSKCELFELPTTKSITFFGTNHPNKVIITQYQCKSHCQSNGIDILLNPESIILDKDEFITMIPIKQNVSNYVPNILNIVTPTEKITANLYIQRRKYWSRRLLSKCFNLIMYKYNVQMAYTAILNNYCEFFEQFLRVFYYHNTNVHISRMLMMIYAQEIFISYQKFRKNIIPFCFTHLQATLPLLRNLLLLYPWREYTFDGTHWITQLLKLYDKGKVFGYHGTMGFVICEWGFILNRQLLPRAAESHFNQCHIMIEPLMQNLFHALKFEKLRYIIGLDNAARDFNIHHYLLYYMEQQLLKIYKNTHHKLTKKVVAIYFINTPRKQVIINTYDNTKNDEDIIGYIITTDGGFTYNTLNMKLRVCVEKTHIARLYRKMCVKTSRDFPFICEAINHITNNAAVRGCQPFDISDSAYKDPLDGLICYIDAIQHRLPECQRIIRKALQSGYNNCSQSTDTLTHQLYISRKADFKLLRWLRHWIIHVRDNNHPVIIALIFGLLKEGVSAADFINPDNFIKYVFSNTQNVNTSKSVTTETTCELPSTYTPLPIIRHIILWADPFSAIKSSKKLSFKFGYQCMHQLQYAWHGLFGWYINRNVHQWTHDFNSCVAIKSKSSKVQTRLYRSQEQTEVELLYNNQCGSNAIQGGSNKNEKVHADIRRYLYGVRILCGFNFDTALNFIELKQDYNAWKYINNHLDKFPHCNKSWLQKIKETIDEIISLYHPFNAFDNKLFVNFTVIDYKTYISASTNIDYIKPTPWNASDTQLMCFFCCIHQKNIFFVDNKPTVTVNDYIMDICFKLYGHRFTKIKLLQQLKLVAVNMENIKYF